MLCAQAAEGEMSGEEYKKIVRVELRRQRLMQSECIICLDKLETEADPEAEKTAEGEPPLTDSFVAP